MPAPHRCPSLRRSFLRYKAALPRSRVIAAIPSPLSSAELEDRTRAALLGLAVGDALAFPLKGVPAASLQRLPALAEDFAPRPRGRYAKGQFSSHTQLMLATADSVILERKVDGRSAAAHYAHLWTEGVLLQPSRPLAEAVERLSAGTPWMSAGAPMGVKDPAALSRALVVGLWEDEPARLSHDAGVLAVVSHKDPTCAAAAAAYARAVSLGLSGVTLSPTAFCEAVAAAASGHDQALGEELLHLPRLLSWDLDRALDQVRRVGVAPSVLAAQDGVPSHVTPVLLCALYAALRIPHDFRESLSIVLKLGGDADVAASLLGGILGAHLGTDGIPARLRRNVLYGEHLSETATRLCAARINRRTASAAVAAAKRRA